MPTVADVLRRYGGEYLEQFGATMPGEHKKVLRAITACRTGALGTVLYACESCGRTHAVGRSCGNRHCPTCQQDKTQAWLEKQTRSPAAVPLLPGHLHAAGGAARTGSQSPARGLRRAVRGLQRGAARLGGGPEVRRHGSPRLLRRLAHLGPDAGVPPARALRRAGRRPQRRRLVLVAVAGRLPRAGPGPVDRLPGQVPRSSSSARAC